MPQEEVTYEESLRLLRAPYQPGYSARIYGRLEAGAYISYRTYHNDPSYCEIIASFDGVLTAFTAPWEVVAGYDTNGNQITTEGT